MGNRSLDEFVPDGPGDGTADADGADDADDGPDGGNGSSPGQEADGTPDGDEAGGGDGPQDTPVDPGTVEPAASTYAATPGACAACGGRAETRWESEAGLVCPDCKEW